VPLASGPNSLVLTLKTLDGRTTTRTVLVNATGNPTPIVLSATPSIGVTPLTSDFTVRNRTGAAISKIEFDANGDGHYIDVTAFNGRFSGTYNAVGTYHPAVRVTDAAAHVYAATTTVVVYDGSSLDPMLRAMWTSMNNALVAGDLVGATRYLSDAAASIYAPAFTTLNGSFPGIVASYGTFSTIRISAGYAEYALTRVVGSSRQVFLIYFVRDGDAIWRLDSM